MNGGGVICVMSQHCNVKLMTCLQYPFSVYCSQTKTQLQVKRDQTLQFLTIILLRHDTIQHPLLGPGSKTSIIADQLSQCWSQGTALYIMHRSSDQCTSLPRQLASNLGSTSNDKSPVLQKTRGTNNSGGHNNFHSLLFLLLPVTLDFITDLEQDQMKTKPTNISFKRYSKIFLTLWSSCLAPTMWPWRRVCVSDMALLPTQPLIAVIPKIFQLTSFWNAGTHDLRQVKYLRYITTRVNAAAA